MTTTTLIIARHGNTFEAGETPRRVGARTDLPLTQKGRDQARSIGRYLKQNNLLPDAVYSSHLKRTVETASLAAPDIAPQPLAIFNEIDYGPDENKTEDEVIARIGLETLKAWDEHAAVPQGWNADPVRIVSDLEKFADDIARNCAGKKILVVTSNGIARFFPHLTGDFEAFRLVHSLKIATGAVCVLDHDGTRWSVRVWNARP